ncbi:MAG TPA: hypothetical protein VD931_18600 [Baekduia sp.]|nr:hypothetical protein [Baekduia sp.]
MRLLFRKPPSLVLIALAVLVCGALLLAERDDGAPAVRSTQAAERAATSAPRAPSAGTAAPAVRPAKRAARRPSAAQRRRAVQRARSEVRQAVRAARRGQATARAAQLPIPPIQSIVCPILLQLRAGPLGGIAGPALDALIARFGCTVPSG